MKQDIHPNYKVVQVKCACGNTFYTKSTKSELKLDICSACHPLFTGKQKFIDTEGRISKFLKKFEKAKTYKENKDQARSKAKATAARKRAVSAASKKSKTLTTSPITKKRS
ncbi:50S ribosomal protein L31 [Elusimicrobiota bacterium]